MRAHSSDAMWLTSDGRIGTVICVVWERVHVSVRGRKGEGERCVRAMHARCGAQMCSVQYVERVGAATKTAVRTAVDETDPLLTDASTHAPHTPTHRIKSNAFLSARGRLRAPPFAAFRSPLCALVPRIVAQQQ
jgi:hypothetical protein